MITDVDIPQDMNTRRRRGFWNSRNSKIGIDDARNNRHLCTCYTRVDRPEGVLALAPY
jgi:hypothetical protein